MYMDLNIIHLQTNFEIFIHFCGKLCAYKKIQKWLLVKTNAYNYISFDVQLCQIQLQLSI